MRRNQVRLDERSRRVRSEVLGLVLAVAAVVLLGTAGGASAAPLYYFGLGLNGVDPQGRPADFDLDAPPGPGNPFDLTLDPDCDLFGGPPECDDFEVLIPEDMGGDPTVVSDPASPSFATPFIAESSWMVTNDTGVDWFDVHVSIEFVLSSYFDQHPTFESELTDRMGWDVDVPGFEMALIAGSGITSLALPVGDIPDGSSASGTVRYVVAGELPMVGSDIDLPDLFVQLFASSEPVPEPGVLILLAGPALALGIRERRRRRS